MLVKCSVRPLIDSQTAICLIWLGVPRGWFWLFSYLKTIWSTKMSNLIYYQSALILFWVLSSKGQGKNSSFSSFFRISKISTSQIIEGGTLSLHKQADKRNLKSLVCQQTRARPFCLHLENKWKMMIRSISRAQCQNSWHSYLPALSSFLNKFSDRATISVLRLSRSESR